MKRILYSALALGGLIALSACGTTYQVPKPDEANTVEAQRMFAEVRSQSHRPSLSTAQAEQRFNRVASRIHKVGLETCLETAAQLKSKLECNAAMAIDRETNERNAYFTYDKNKKPVVMVTLPLLKDTTSDDEVAFVLGHEYGHLIGQHIEKQQQQELVGALILGSIAAAANSYSVSNGGYDDQSMIDNSVIAGGALGSAAFSQTYELESDTLGTLIARSAGYDPIKGAQFFARPEKTKTENGKLSFWGTHPPNEKRLATVIATSAKIDANARIELK